MWTEEFCQNPTCNLRAWVRNCMTGIIISQLSLFWEIKGGLCNHHAVCVCVSLPSTFEWMNQSLWYFYVYHGTWAHLNGVLHKSLPLVCLYVYPRIVTRQRLGKNLSPATNTQTTEELSDVFFSMWSAAYAREVGNYFFPELLVSMLYL
jgi:hypothetical protein